MIAFKYKNYTALFIGLSLIYLAQVTLIAPDQKTLNKYNLSAGQLLALVLTIALPYIIIWFVALVGYLRLKSYVSVIAGSKDGAAFATISLGVLLLALWMPLSAILSGFTTHYYHLHAGQTANMVRLDNYFNVAILLPAFYFINRGSFKLLALVKKPVASLPQFVTLLLIGLSAAYVYLTLHDPVRQFPSGGIAVASYYLPDWLTLLTIIIPRLIMWYLGIQACYNILIYMQKVKGSLYKESLRKLAIGVGWVVVTVIVLRSMQSLSTLFNHLSLGVVLGVVYVLLIIMSIGFVFIAKGSKSLQKIEEI